MIRRLRIGDADTGGKLHTSGKFSTCLNNVSSKFAASIKDNGRKQSILPLDVSALQQPVPPMDVCVVQQTVSPGQVFPTGACADPVISGLQQHVMPLDVSFL
jgi:hypothetical protein